MTGEGTFHTPWWDLFSCHGGGIIFAAPRLRIDLTILTYFCYGYFFSSNMPSSFDMVFDVLRFFENDQNISLKEKIFSNVQIFSEAEIRAASILKK